MSSLKRLGASDIVITTQPERHQLGRLAIYLAIITHVWSVGGQSALSFAVNQQLRLYVNLPVYATSRTINSRQRSERR